MTVFGIPVNPIGFLGEVVLAAALVATHSSLRLSILIEFTVPADSLLANH